MCQVQNFPFLYLVVYVQITALPVKSQSLATQEISNIRTISFIHLKPDIEAEIHFLTLLG